MPGPGSAAASLYNTLGHHSPGPAATQPASAGDKGLPGPRRPRTKWQYWQVEAYHGVLEYFGADLNVADSAITTEEVDSAQLASELRPARKQVLWLLAPNSDKVNWLKAARPRTKWQCQGYYTE